MGIKEILTLVGGLVLQVVEKAIERRAKRKEGQEPTERPPLKTKKTVDDYRAKSRSSTTGSA